MFFLLLFFLITSTMATPNVLKLLLPNAKSSVQGFKHPISISVTEDLQYAVNNTPVTKDELEATLKSMIAGQPDPTALLKVDKTVQVQNLVDLLDIGNRLKIKMVLATQTSSSTAKK
jgi:biopolymer transport protein ExbD